jgi:IS1 family transposase/lambda repressor-like predicted transcriptional regulator
MRGMNKLPRDKRVQIISLLTEGMSLRAITRTTGVSINTVTKLLVDAGKACSDYQDRHLRGLACKRVQVDEIWAFCYAKARNVADAKAAPDQAGDIWTWTAIDADTKLVLSWLVASRDSEAAHVFIQDVQSRLAERVQLTSDGHPTYLMAVWKAFGREVDYAQLVKQYGPAPEPAGRYSPAQCVGAEKRRFIGSPDQNHISTSYVERQNLTMRMHMRQFTRLTNAFSKKAENHAYAVALHFMAYNFVRIHKTQRAAECAGLSDRVFQRAVLRFAVAMRDCVWIGRNLPRALGALLSPRQMVHRHTAQYCPSPRSFSTRWIASPVRRSIPMDSSVPS